MILPLVTKTTFAPGARIPTSSVKPVATWVAEGGTSEKQKKTTGYIDIRGFKLRCAISMTLEAVTMSLAVFETVFVNSIAEAMVKAQEEAIVNGDGEGKPKGILNETAPEGQSIEVGDKDSLYKKLVEAEAALPLAYENGAVWNMTKKTFMAFVGEMDANGQPIARVNQGIDGKPERTLLGRKVVLNDYMDSYGAATEADATVAFLYDWSDYMFNTNYAMTVKKYEDNDTEDEITKAVMICDGKSLELNSLVGTRNDEEINELAMSRVRELENTGVYGNPATDALYYQAMVLYCKANFGYDENTERFQTAFEKLRDSMALSGDYAKEKKNGNGGTDLGENL